MAPEFRHARAFDAAEGAGAASDARTGDGAGAASAGSKRASAPSAPVSGSRCHTPELTAGFGADGGGIPDMKANQTVAAVRLENVGSGTCTLKGFPGVDIQDNMKAGHVVSLPRSSKAAAEVTLKPGAYTGFLITLLPADATTSKSQRIEPGMLIVTPPNEKEHIQLKWPFGGEILNQEGATHPGTFVDPIGAG
ncbi:DUF4232 domain-containing protein [Streptomyces sp. NPDC058092]|uniref:DUF4232 domain-containing protein n=1 Tax=Streptomyces sp. NPDC058092 TaxID=3346336 RepID=UPI0036E5F558